MFQSSRGTIAMSLQSSSLSVAVFTQRQFTPAQSLMLNITSMLETLPRLYNRCVPDGLV
jgi:hypothetical protein